jgi:hypothetical protein
MLGVWSSVVVLIIDRGVGVVWPAILGAVALTMSLIRVWLWRVDRASAAIPQAEDTKSRA